MTVYRKIQPEFWTGRTGRQLRGQADLQLVAMYLMTCTHANMIGVFTCPPAYIANDLGMPLEGASKALQSLSEGGFCAFDADLDLVWVKEMAKYQVGDELKETDNQVKSIRSLYRAIPNPLIRRAFFEKYGVAYHLEEIASDLETARALEAPSEPLRSQEQEQEQYQKQDSGSSLRSEPEMRGLKAIVAPPADIGGSRQSLALIAEPPPKPRKPVKATPENATAAEQAAFETWWAVYPHKVSKQAALLAFANVLRFTGVQAPHLSERAQLYGEWLVHTGTLPANGATWLNGRRWEDHLDFSPRQSQQPRHQWSSMDDAMGSMTLED